MLTLLVLLLVFCLVYWCAMQLMSAFGVGDPIRTVIIVILVIIGIYVALGQLGIGVPSLR